jgi:membrane fusion protein (multidrug efflux system)
VNREQRLLLTLLAAALLGWSCAEAPEPAPEEATTEAPPVNVSVATVEPSVLKDELALAGRLEPWVEVLVSTELGGTVREVGFDKGRNVQKGQVLARIGTDLFEAALAEAEAELVAAEANFNKTRELFERQAVPRQELVAATSSYKSAEARVRQAKLRVERSILEAPIGGVAVTREIEPGEVVSPGALVTTIHQVSHLKASVGIPENDIAYFELGADARIAVDAYPDREFRGKIHFLAPAATGVNRTFPAEITIDNRDGELRPGMIVRVALVRRVYENAIVVPRDAVLERDTGTVLFVVKGDKAELRKVATGPSERSRIVILDGLAAGEELIVGGHRNLVDGQRVRVVSARSAGGAS